MKPNRLKVTAVSSRNATIHTGCRMCSGTKNADGGKDDERR